MAGNKKHAAATEAKPTRAFVRLDAAELARVEAVAEALGATPAGVRTMAFREGLEALELRVLGVRGDGPENAVGSPSKFGLEKPLGYPRMSGSEKADLEARIDDLEARISSVSEAGLGSLAMLSLVLDRCMESTRSDGQEEG